MIRKEFPFFNGQTVAVAARTGVVLNSEKRVYTEVYGGGGSSVVVGAGGNVTGYGSTAPVQTAVHHEHELWIRQDDGEEYCTKLGNDRVETRSDQIVTLFNVAAATPGIGRWQNFCGFVKNHNTDRFTVVYDVQAFRATNIFVGPPVRAYRGLLALGLVAVPFSFPNGSAAARLIANFGVEITCAVIAVLVYFAISASSRKEAYWKRVFDDMRAAALAMVPQADEAAAELRKRLRQPVSTTVTKADQF
jgi:hypothetical protein